VGVRDLTLSARAADGLRGLRQSPAHDWARRAMIAHRVVSCLIASAALYACAMTYADMHQRSALTSAGVTIATVIYAGFALVPIMRWPLWLPVAATTAGAVAMMAAGTPDTLVGPALVVTVFVFSVRSEKTPVIAGTAAVVGVLLLGHLAFELHSDNGWADVAVVPWTVVAAAVGQAVRAKRAHQAMLEERARRAEESREQEARRRVQEERLRIARELHDAVGHHVALISVQAGAMGYLLDSDQVKARESLAHIQQASEAALEELRLTVGLLRQPGDSEPTEPAWGLARLGELIGSFAATGLRVTCDVSGEARQLPEAVDLTAYRIIQESLTNTAKHAAGSAVSLRLAYRPGVLALSVEDDGPFTGELPESGEGHGIVGMRERAAALGGWLSAGPRPGGGFRVLAELPGCPGS
jgi:signal transduction histidine kinase